jgi:hypothetical protein
VAVRRLHQHASLARGDKLGSKSAVAFLLLNFCKRSREVKGMRGSAPMEKRAAWCQRSPVDGSINDGIMECGDSGGSPYTEPGQRAMGGVE